MAGTRFVLGPKTADAKRQQFFRPMEENDLMLFNDLLDEGVLSPEEATKIKWHFLEQPEEIWILQGTTAELPLGIVIIRVVRNIIRIGAAWFNPALPTVAKYVRSLNGTNFSRGRS